MNFKTIGRRLTSPAAFSWYGVIGVAVTAVLTYISTKKYVEQQKEEPEPITLGDKVKEVSKTALIFAPSIAAGIATSACIVTGNRMAASTIRDLRTANNAMASRLSGMAVGAAASEARSRFLTEDCAACNPPKYWFSNDPKETEDYGRVVKFYDTFTESWFNSTILDVALAEEALHKTFNLQGWVTVGDFQIFLGNKPEEWTYRCGWDDEIGYRRSYSWVEFLHHRVVTEDGEVYYTIEYQIPPAFEEEFEWYMPEVDEIPLFSRKKYSQYNEIE